MGHKTITISDEAYSTLAKKKKGKESFTDVILRMTGERGKASALLKYLENMPPSEDLAENIEKTVKRTRRAKLRRVSF